MAIRVYNTKQQELNSKKISELFLFSTNDFAGLISDVETPVICSADCWKWNEEFDGKEISLVGNGVSIGFDVDATKEYTYVVTNNSSTGVWGFDITVPNINASVVTNTFTPPNASLSFIPADSVTRDWMYFIVENPTGNPSFNGYYEFEGNNRYVETQDTEVDDEKVYYVRGGESYTVTNARFIVPGTTTDIFTTFDYFGNTIRVTEDRFFIPVCGHNATGYIPMLFNRDKAGYESFLSARTYMYLLKALGDQFVWRKGGKILGDIGNLNVTDNAITNKFHTTGRDDEIVPEARFINNGDIVIQSPAFTGIRPQAGDLSLQDVLRMDTTTGKVYVCTDFVTTIERGGTGATNEGDARQNLNITSGTSDPSGEPTRSVGGADIGAIYLKIL